MHDFTFHFVCHFFCAQLHARHTEFTLSEDYEYATVRSVTRWIRSTHTCVATKPYVTECEPTSNAATRPVIRNRAWNRVLCIVIEPIHMTDSRCTRIAVNTLVRCQWGRKVWRASECVMATNIGRWPNYAGVYNRHINIDAILCGSTFTQQHERIIENNSGSATFLLCILMAYRIMGGVSTRRTKPYRKKGNKAKPAISHPPPEEDIQYEQQENAHTWLCKQQE